MGAYSHTHGSTSRPGTQMVPGSFTVVPLRKEGPEGADEARVRRELWRGHEQLSPGLGEGASRRDPSKIRAERAGEPQATPFTRRAE
eukprot:2057093-Rhodomonas_salina.1